MHHLTLRLMLVDGDLCSENILLRRKAVFLVMNQNGTSSEIKAFLYQLAVLVYIHQDRTSLMLQSGDENILPHTGRFARLYLDQPETVPRQN